MHLEMTHIITWYGVCVYTGGGGGGGAQCIVGVKYTGGLSRVHCVIFNRLYCVSQKSTHVWLGIEHKAKDEFSKTKHV